MGSDIPIGCRISRDQYDAILGLQRAGRLTIFIDMSSFRTILDRASARKFGEGIGQSVAGRLFAIKLLSRVDFPALVVACIVSIPAFRWWALLVIPATAAFWMICRGAASVGRPSVIGPSLWLAVALWWALAFWNISIWIRLYCLTGTLAISMCYVLYYVVARVVFGLIHSSYEFFSMFYLQTLGSLGPFIWTQPEMPPAGFHPARE
jgi:hypothetical protein